MKEPSKAAVTAAWITGLLGCIGVIIAAIIGLGLPVAEKLIGPTPTPVVIVVTATAPQLPELESPTPTNIPELPTPPPPEEPPSTPPLSLCPDYVPRSKVQEWNIGATTDVKTVDEKVEEFNSFRKWQTYPYGNFRAGDQIPAGVVVATAFDGASRRWNEFPVIPLVHRGDYGLFETVGEYIAPYEGACISIAP